MTVATTYVERMALIAKLAKKHNLRTERLRAIDHKEQVRGLMTIPEEGDNINHYTAKDAARYANEFYGETYRETVKFDNDWD